MNHKRPPVPVIIIIVLLVAVSAYFIVTQVIVEDTGALTASGTIEGTIVNVSPEASGKVKQVLVEEGQPVRAGAPVLVIDKSLLAAQRAVAAAQLDSAKTAVTTAESALASAQVQYDLVYSNALRQSDGVRTSDWFRDEPDAFSLPLWYYTQTEQLNAAFAEVEAAKASLVEAQNELASFQVQAESADFIKIENYLAAARANYQITKDVHDQLENGPNDTELSRAQQIKIARGWLSISTVDQDLRDSAKQNYDDAKSALDKAQQAYAAAMKSAGADEVLKARAVVSVAQERYYAAMDQVLGLQTGESSLTVIAAQKALEQTESAVAQASATVRQAEANLALLDTQIDKLTVAAPMDGVILTRNIEPGEFVQPGAVAFALADLNNITITVYVPEDRYGQISLGQKAQVTVDSFPGTTFTAEVVHIADQAEFTPRNIQTVEGRSSTVYAIKLKVTDSEGRLKIGMPADVLFK